MSKILVIGANGQLGSELTTALRATFGDANIVASDIQKPLATEGIYEVLDVLDQHRLKEIVNQYEITEIYHLAAMLSAKAEENYQFAWRLNMDGLLNVLEIAKEKKVKVYWPSSIGVFGPGTPKDETPQHSFSDTNTVYGISKLAGERWCQYYFEKFGVDVRSLRYPGLIGYKSLPGGGTTDYAVDIFYKAIKRETFNCFLHENTTLPMMYMADAVRATIELMQAPQAKIKVRSSYNLAAMSFSPAEIFQAIKVRYPGFSITYHPDFRQNIANSWPRSIDDSAARNDWGWKHEYGLAELVEVMLTNLAKNLVAN